MNMRRRTKNFIWQCFAFLGLCIGIFTIISIGITHNINDESTTGIHEREIVVRSNVTTPTTPNHSPANIVVRSNVTTATTLNRSPATDLASYKRAIETYISSDNWITLALADQGCLDMTVNLYKTSLRPLHIDNYLIIGSDDKTCAILQEYQINCYTYMVDKDAGHSSNYFSRDFNRKMAIRTYMILDALRMGYNVLHTDLDMFYMKNPYEEFDYKSGSYDLALLWDWSSYNAGFLFLRATAPAIKVYEASARITDKEPQTVDQHALNRAIKSVKGAAITKLSIKKFQCGRQYWDKGKRNFIEDQACPECVVVHDNWIVSMEAKRYRLREIGMWAVDMGGYYSDVKRKYLIYDNEIILNDPTKENLKSLQNALAIGDILNRTVILPKFHCKNTRCTILEFLLLREFEKYFVNYREHSFLQNTLVPQEIRNSISTKQVILSDKYTEINHHDTRGKEQENQVYQPADFAKGATSTEIMTWFGNKQDAVLSFDNMLGSFCCFSDPGKQKSFEKKVKLGFKSGKYKQV